MSEQKATMKDVLTFYQQKVQGEYRAYSPESSAADFRTILHAKVAAIISIQAGEYGISEKAAENYTGHELEDAALAAFEELKKWVLEYTHSQSTS